MTRQRWFGRVALGVTLACGVFAYLRPVLGEKRAPRPRASITGALAERSLYRLGASFQTDEARAFQLPELRGNFQVLALIFTRCPSVCPTLVHDMQALERAMPTDVKDATRFTLVSIDPTHDTPDALRAYRKKLGLSPERWLLLRGEPDPVRDLSALLGFSYSSSTSSGLPLAHSKLVTVLNRECEIIHQQESVSADPQKIIDAIFRAL
jgi:protein SCO1/2